MKTVVKSKLRLDLGLDITHPRNSPSAIIRTLFKAPRCQYFEPFGSKSSLVAAPADYLPAVPACSRSLSIRARATLMTEGSSAILRKIGAIAANSTNSPRAADSSIALVS